MVQQVDKTENGTESEDQNVTDHFLPSSDSAQQKELKGRDDASEAEDDSSASFCVQLKTDVGFRGRVIHTAWLWWTFVGLGLVIGQVGPSFPDLRLIAGQDLDVGSLIFTLFSLGYMVGSLVSGFLYERWNKLFLIIVSTWMMALFSLVLPWCKVFPVMLAVRFLAGFGCGSLDTVGNADIVSVWDEAGRPYFQALHFFFGVGGIISPFYTEPFLAKKTCDSHAIEGIELDNNTSTTSPIDNTTWDMDGSCTSWAYKDSNIHYAFIITCVFLILSSIPFIIMFIDKMRSKRRHSIQANKDSLERPDKLPFGLKVCLLFLICTMFFVYCAIEDSFGGLMMTFCLNYLEYDKNIGSLATSLYYACFSVGRFSGIFLIQMFSPIQWLFTFSALMVASLLCFVVSSVYLIYPLIWVSTGLVGFSCSLMFPCMFTWTEESVLKVTGMVSSLFLLSSSVGLMVNPIFLGFMMENLTPLWYAYLFFAESLLLVVLLFVTFIIVKKFVRPLGENASETEPTSQQLKSF